MHKITPSKKVEQRGRKYEDTGSERRCAHSGNDAEEKCNEGIDKSRERHVDMHVYGVRWAANKTTSTALQRAEAHSSQRERRGALL